jgi:hypothetical protein
VLEHGVVDGVTNRPAWLRSAAKTGSEPCEYERSTYPMEKGVLNTVAPTPALPSAPTPTGHLTVRPVPRRDAHAGSTLER